MSEPFYIRQCAGLTENAERLGWVDNAAIEARGEGATWIRASYHPVYTDVLLVEGWKERPAEEGEPRFFMTAGPEKKRISG